MFLSYSKKRFEEASQYISNPLFAALQKIPDDIKAKAHEIRLRSGRPLSLTLSDNCFFVCNDGQVGKDISKSVIVTTEDIETTFSYLCDMSVYSFANEIKEGFITLKGGHRAGICGKAIIENNEIVGLKDISSINIRIAREIIGCANAIIPHLMCENIVEGCIIASPPGGGKTTILRDISRILSNSGLKVAVIDERGEIGAAFEGVPQNNLGAFCDLFDGYPKDKGIMQSIRSLSPDVIICDEIGSENEARAMLSGMNAGVPVISSVHAKSIEEARQRPQINMLLNSGAVKTFIVLYGRDSPCKIKKVYKTGENQNENFRYDNNIFSPDLCGVL